MKNKDYLQEFRISILKSILLFQELDKNIQLSELQDLVKLLYELVENNDWIWFIKRFRMFT